MNYYTEFQKHIEARTLKTLEKASKYSLRIIEETAKSIDDYVVKNKLDSKKICFVAVGSIGRREALGASDLDIIPILLTPSYLNKFKYHDKRIRKHIANKHNIKVSAGDDLTKCISIDQLTNLKGIGGNEDNNSLLTKRILILTEGAQVYGGFTIDKVRNMILDSYSKNETTRGKHILTLCNDLARYYRTLCIEYKAKIDVTNKDWGSRNAKLRHSRKVWYFATLLSMIQSSKSHYYEISNFKRELLTLFNEPPLIRLFRSVEIQQYIIVGKLLNYYAWFLEYMSFKRNREKLTKVKYSNRYDDINNDYYKLKMNSDMVHRYICSIMNDLHPSQKQKLIDWFLL